MKILVTGGNGMLAHAILKELKNVSGAEVLSGDKDVCDITDKRVIDRIFAEFQPDLVLNCAAYTAVDKAEDDLETAMAVNAAGAKNLAEACRDSSAVLVHFSTDYVFKGDKKGYDEDDERGPIGAYGLSKAKGEEYIEEIMAGKKYYIARTSWLYGPNGPNFADTMIRLAGERDSLSVVDDQHGTPTLTIDLAKAALELVHGEFAPGTYHLTNSGDCTWYEYACRIFDLKGIDIEVEPVDSSAFPRKAVRPAFSILNNNKGPSLRHWKEALEYYIENFT
ncbi:dTDP-4-dehydrorhamnose reductase [Candidatus Peregrinibacteria bacterium]|jgi:dTDP-4-dehydrorhamnose reductase|nr:dTDP-4-dehydrorhamnose reductase [Candidatus Peregrinibacteria bacterium]